MPEKLLFLLTFLPGADTPGQSSYNTSGSFSYCHITLISPCIAFPKCREEIYKCKNTNFSLGLCFITHAAGPNLGYTLLAQALFLSCIIFSTTKHLAAYCRPFLLQHLTTHTYSCQILVALPGLGYIRKISLCILPFPKADSEEAPGTDQPQGSVLGKYTACAALHQYARAWGLWQVIRPEFSFPPSTVSKTDFEEMPPHRPHSVLHMD